MKMIEENKAVVSPEPVSMTQHVIQTMLQSIPGEGHSHFGS